MEQPTPTYEDLTISNKGLIPETLQKRLWDTRVAVLGCGLGSEVLRQLTQTGLREFILADPDIVELSNLNRQNYSIEQAREGLKKVDASKQKVLEINPQASIHTHIEGVTLENAQAIVDQADIIIDNMDPFDAINQAIQINHLAREQGKTVLYPAELAWDGLVYVFTPESLTIDEFFQISRTVPSPIPPEIHGLIAQTLLKDGSPTSHEVAQKFLKGELPKYPQLAITTAATAALTTRIALQIISLQELGQPLFSDRSFKIAPEPNIISL